ncbi:MULTISPECIES: cupin domain-containing protein [unclassified Rhodanobacter]|uniref:Cupin domain-containing protein n=1 Tax=Rhodanobacter humi TaxID=1888173 RepID=A0ABV4AV46_9GAMM
MTRSLRRLFAFVAPVALVASGPLLAHEPAGKESHQLLMQQALPDAPGKHVVMLTVNYAPGASSDAHLHPGSVFAYVLDGAVVSQLEGQPARTYHKGESWYEPPRTHHLVSRNASGTQPATLLVLAVAGEGEPVKLPLPDAKATAMALPRIAGH